MHDTENLSASAKRIPWNKGKLTGAKPPLRPKHVWAIRTKLQIGQLTRDLALFNLAIDSKLRGCDVVAVKVDDVAPSGYAVDRASVRQKKTGRPVRFELTEPTRQAVDDYIKVAGKKLGEFLFAGRRPGHCMTTRQYARLESEWLTTRTRSASVWHALATPDQGYFKLPAHRKPACRPASPRPHEDREHREIPWYRG